MKALVYTAPEQIELRDEPDPQAGAGEVLVKVEAVGICGSDMHAFLGHDARRPAPLILGHEACGTALAGRYEGQRVVVNPLVSCGHCDACQGGRANLCAARQIISMPPRPGAFAELAVIPERNLLPVPEGMDGAAAALTEPVATALHGVTVGEQRLHRPLGEAARVLVLGGGAVGLSAALVLRARGAREIWLGETNPSRRRTASDEGDFKIYDPITEFAPVDAFDLVIDAVGGRATREAASAAVAPGGVIVHIGLAEAEGGLDIRKLTLQEVTFIGTYTYTMVDFRASVEALHSGALGSLAWIERRPLAAGAEAFQQLRAGQVSAAKVILEP